MTRTNPTEYEPEFKPASRGAQWFVDWTPWTSTRWWKCQVCGKRGKKNQLAWKFRGGPATCQSCHNTLCIERAIIEEGTTEGEGA